jgi:fructokinase
VILAIGEILFDIFPSAKRLGGAPFNFSYHLKQLGLPVRFISRVGSDQNGRAILKRLKEFGFNCDDIQLDDDHHTGTVQVQLDTNGVPTFDIVSDVAYDHIDLGNGNYAEYLQSARLVYFGTLIQRTHQAFMQMQKFLQLKKPETSSFYDINLRPGCYSEQIIKSSFQHTDILKLNSDELKECKRIIGAEQDDPTFIRYLMNQYSISSVALTKGDNGSEFYTYQELSQTAPYPVNSLVDTVGAGDAYAAVLAVGILMKWSPKATISRATDFASRICTIQGAIPESTEFYEPIRKLMSNEV